MVKPFGPSRLAPSSGTIETWTLQRPCWYAAERLMLVSGGRYAAPTFHLPPCPPEYCACPGDGIDHPAPSDEQEEDPLQALAKKAALDPFRKDRPDWLDNPAAVPMPELDNPREEVREDAFEQFRRRLFPRERHATERSDELVSDPRRTIERVYDQLEIPMSEAFRKRLDRETQRARTYKSSHGYSLEEYGLDAQTIKKLVVLFRFGHQPRHKLTRSFMGYAQIA